MKVKTLHMNFSSVSQTDTNTKLGMEMFLSVSVWFGQQNVLSRHIHANLVVEKRKVWIDYTIEIA